ncbi:MAG: hypothetical protein ABIQ90_16570 [Polaromonas sp.]
MTQEERIAALEKQLATLRSEFRETAMIHQELGGFSRMFEGAVLALIASHPRPDLLAPDFHQHMARIEAGAVSAAETEEHLQGVQDAQAILNVALEQSAERFHNLAS